MIAAVESYLAVRRAVGFTLSNTEYLLRSFATFATDRNQTHIRTATAIDWASLAGSVAQRHTRYQTVCRFAQYLCVEDSRHESPPPRYCGANSAWESILDGLAPKTSRVPKAGRLPLADRVLVLVANRLCRPGSEHALAQWLESDFVCGRDGERILARWQQQGRVRVDLNWLKIGIARWTSCSRAKDGSKWNSLAGYATFSTSRSRWSSTT